jgi:hypothetical protein
VARAEIDLQMLADAEFIHHDGLLLDVLTLDTGTPSWRERLSLALEAGVDVMSTSCRRHVDVITSDTPRALTSLR